ncbi:MAG: glycosyltransferase [Gemmatimonadota bacterium]
MTAPAPATAVILSANPIHDTGGGQRSAQIALELLERDHAVLFVSHGKVTETVDLGLSFSHPRLVETRIEEVAGRKGWAVLHPFLSHPRALVLTQIAVSSWLPVLRQARYLGAVCVYDLIDEWESELGYGWYRRGIERRVAELAHALVATAPALQQRLQERTRRPVTLLPNAFNGRLFSGASTHLRPHDLPLGPVALYVGALWGGWMDWGLVYQVARAFPHISFVFIGDHRNEGEGLPENCTFLGLKAQYELPAYLAHAQVGILPWKDDAVTQATSPLKVYEYLAMGLPVVAPALEPLRDVPGVTGCSDPSGFIAAVAKAVDTGPAAATPGEMASFAEEQSWTRRVDTLLELAHRARKEVLPLGLLARLRGRLGI